MNDLCEPFYQANFISNMNNKDNLLNSVFIKEKLTWIKSLTIFWLKPNVSFSFLT